MQADSDSADLDRRIRAHIFSAAPDATEFDRLARDVFAHQYERNEPYRRHCDRAGRTPADVADWSDVPAVTAASFGDVRLATFAPERTVLRFVSSGTTSGGAHRSVHELDTTALYDASLLAHFKRMVLPETQGMRIVGLVPPFSQAPHSSLSYMVSRLIDDVGLPGSGCCIQGDALDMDAIDAAFSATDDVPLLVFGTAFAFVHLFDALRSAGARVTLPRGSRVVETGGFKGRSREIARDELYASFVELLGVPRTSCTSEYGMCELGSQWYDATIADHVNGRPPRFDVKIGPHWTRTRIVDPVTSEPVDTGELGLLQVFDLSNRGSVAAVLTGDLARRPADGEGFVLAGRFAGAPPKGCSIDADVLLGARHD